MELDAHCKLQDPDSPTTRVRENAYDFLHGIAGMLPCDKCKREWSSYLQAHVPSPSSPPLRSRDKFRFLVEGHNFVNAKLGKRELAHQDAKNPTQPTISTGATAQPCGMRQSWPFSSARSLSSGNDATSAASSCEGGCLVARCKCTCHMRILLGTRRRMDMKVEVDSVCVTNRAVCYDAEPDSLTGKLNRRGKRRERAGIQNIAFLLLAT